MAAEQIPGRIARILLIEDNPDDAEITQRAFTRAKIANTIKVVNDGESALEQLLQSYGDPQGCFDMVLLDLGLPRMDGRAVLRAIHGDKRIRHIPVIILTGSDEGDDLISAYKGGAVAFMHKPVSTEHLLSAIGDLHEYRLYIARLDNA
jgi:two-component system, response regulator